MKAIQSVIQSSYTSAVWHKICQVAPFGGLFVFCRGVKSGMQDKKRTELKSMTLGSIPESFMPMRELYTDDSLKNVRRIAESITPFPFGACEYPSRSRLAILG